MITNQNGLLVLNQFSSIVKFPSLEALTAGVDYSVVTNTPISCTVVNSKQITLNSSLSDAVQGDGVLVTIDGFDFENIIDNINSTKDKIILIKDLIDLNDSPLESGTVSIKFSWNKAIKLIDVDEGHYLVKPTNQKIVVRDSWVQPYVSMAELTPEMVDAINLKESRIDGLNKIGLKKIYADLSGLDNYYDIIDEIDLWSILFLKIECMLESDDEVKQGVQSKCTKYESKIASYIPEEGFVENEDGTPSEEIKAFSTGGFTL